MLYRERPVVWRYVKVMPLIANVCQWKRALYADVFAAFTREFSPGLPHLGAKYRGRFNV